MTELLTAKDMQNLLQVDRSTIYRMAEAGRLPAIKVGKQWRFPSEQVDDWLNDQTTSPTLVEQPLSPAAELTAGNLSELLPLECIQLTQDSFANLLGVMLVVTEMNGQPVTQVSQPTPFYNLLAEANDGHALCQEQWQALGQVPALTPRFVPTLAGLLCARALVRYGNELKGMVIAFGVTPPGWSPDPATIAELGRMLNLDLAKLRSAFAAVTRLTPAEQTKVLNTIQHIADIIAHIITERATLLAQLNGK